MGQMHHDHHIAWDPEQGGRTPFDQFSQNELLNMVQHTDPAHVMELGRRLQVAAEKMVEVGDDLLGNMSSLDWEGGAAENFKDWGKKVAQATDQLATYSKVAGDSLLDAGTVLDSVKHGMPELPAKELDAVQRWQSQPNKTVSDAGNAAAKYFGISAGPNNISSIASEVVHAIDGNWVSEPELQAAQTKIDGAQQESVDQMQKLGQSYEQATSRMAQAVPPTFPPTPMAVMPPQDQGQGGLTDVPVGPNKTDPTNGQTAQPGTPAHPGPPAGVTLDHMPAAHASSAPSFSLPSSSGPSVPSGTGNLASPPSPTSSTPAAAAHPAAPAQGQGQGQNRQPMGMMGGMMPHAGGAGGSHGGGSRKSGMTSTPGGVVGGRRGPGVGGTFTEGGSGLRSRAERSGQQAAGGFGSNAARKERERRNKPGYRYDDEDTWTNGTPESNPGVIE